MDGSIDIRVLLSGFSFLVTTYFWFVKARRERPNLEFVQLSDFRCVTRRVRDQEGAKRVCIQQLETGGVLIVNHSTRHDSVVLFERSLLTEDGPIAGDWGYSGDDKPPWNVGPESTIAFSPACFFDVPETYELPEAPVFEIQFLTAGGRRFSHQFKKLAPRFGAAALPASKAA